MPGESASRRERLTALRAEIKRVIDYRSFYLHYCPNAHLSGGRLQTLCPIPAHAHSGTGHPSLSVDLTRGLFHCFSRDEGGDAIRFYELMHEVKFSRAVLELARELGASHCVAAGGDAVAEIRSITAGGAQTTIETVGNELVLAQAFAATRRGGTTVTAGLPHPSKMLSVPAVSLVAEERTIKGSYMGSAVPSRDIPRYVALYRAGLLPVDRLLTHRLRLDEINAGFDRLARGEGVRQVVLFD